MQPGAWKKLKLGPVKYAEIFTGEKPKFEEKRAVKKASKNSLSTSRGGETPKTPKTPAGKESNGKASAKTTPTKRGQSEKASKSTPKTPKMDTDAMTKEFIK